MTFNEVKLRQLTRLIYEWEMALRDKYKYSDESTTTWGAVNDMYRALRSEYLVVDLMDEDLDAH